MAIETTQKFCNQCQRLVPATREGANHILHLLLTLLTCGLWLLIWFGRSFTRIGGWRCTVCGGTKLLNPPR